MRSQGPCEVPGSTHLLPYWLSCHSSNTPIYLQLQGFVFIVSKPRITGSVAPFRAHLKCHLFLEASPDHLTKLAHSPTYCALPSDPQNSNPHLRRILFLCSDVISFTKPSLTTLFKIKHSPPALIPPPWFPLLCLTS